MNGKYKLVNKFLESDLNICDVGAAGGINKRWTKIKKLCVIGFEPDEREFFKLDTSSRNKWFNIGLNYTQGVYPLYITKYQTNTSLYKPNLSKVNQLSYNDDDFNVDKVVELTCDTLDSVLLKNKLSLDYIKLDTQGSELDILKGGSDILINDLFAVEVEVEFCELYLGQPMFADVDIFMRGMGFDLMDIGNMLHVKGKNTVGIGGQKSFLISGDALYFKSIEKVIDLVKNGGLDKLRRIAAICLVYGYNDYALEICYSLIEKNILPQTTLNDLILDLKKSRKLSYYIPEFKFKSYVSKLFLILSDLFSKTKNASWINNLGNIND